MDGAFEWAKVACLTQESLRHSRGGSPFGAVGLYLLKQYLSVMLRHRLRQNLEDAGTLHHLSGFLLMIRFDDRKYALTLDHDRRVGVRESGKDAALYSEQANLNRRRKVSCTTLRTPARQGYRRGSTWLLQPLRKATREYFAMRAMREEQLYFCCCRKNQPPPP